MLSLLRAARSTNCDTTEHVLAVHQAQVLTYMNLTGCPVGLLINST
jgi:hypothetical protein